jgi:hypothetical protein
MRLRISSETGSPGDADNQPAIPHIQTFLVLPTLATPAAAAASATTAAKWRACSLRR